MGIAELAQTRQKIRGWPGYIHRFQNDGGKLVRVSFQQALQRGKIVVVKSVGQLSHALGDPQMAGG